MSAINNSINGLRILSAEAIQKANSGHPGLPLGAAPMAYTLWANQMKHNPKNPKWFDRDRFVLSAGHGSALLYSLLHMFEYGLTKEDLMSFRQLNSLTPGHPEYRHTAGVEMTTGPLGQGISTAVGMAIAETYMAEKFNRDGFKVVDHHTFTIAGDGCMMEGISSEAASLAGTLGLGKLIALYDSNNISIEGDTNIAFRENVGKRFEAYGWEVIKVEDGNDLEAIEKAIVQAKADETKPTLIEVKTVIGFGCEAKQGTSSAHGEPLGADNLAATKAFFNWTAEPFELPQDVKTHMDEVVKGLANGEEAWNEMFEGYKKAYPELAEEFTKWLNNEYVNDIEKIEDYWKFDGAKASRVSSQEVINKLSVAVPNLIGGAADLAPSTKSLMPNRGHFSAEDRSGSNLHFGVREHAMTAIANGMALHGGLNPYVAGFFVFSDYMKPSMRMASIMGLPVTYIMTHDSIGVGEDGPTHQPIEHLLMLRSIPNMQVIRPADYKETAAAWLVAQTSKETPTAIVLSRQNLMQYENSGKEALKGAYIVKEASAEPKLVLVGTGSEVELAYKTAEKLEEEGIPTRVVSMPCWSLFDAQDESYRQSILPVGVKKMSIEAASTMGWHKYVDKAFGLDGFGASGPANQVFEMFGFTVENMVNEAKALLK